MLLTNTVSIVAFLAALQLGHIMRGTALVLHTEDLIIIPRNLNCVDVQLIRQVQRLKGLRGRRPCHHSRELLSRTTATQGNMSIILHGY
ncbi:uncharacterized protein EDB91DRAFT_754902 [Suillus paluster]|uniref:uncharacterized protein n=1 Tax=Suillus paluster TaxID=48578 RepID=UPI001B864902|nr:uncharacterized protein EDB91DRAFT_754902 [Suillus paluster]KAG1749629.1 hypothetical protein EDB91DRAFT_754902 [Suillus paluster]